MNGKTVLCVDDEPNILDGLKRQLRKEFQVHTAVGGRQALAAIARDGPFAVVLSDYNMPEMNGVELLRRVREAAPDTVTLMLTGRADLDIVVAALHEGQIFRFLNKPVRPEVLLQSVHDAFEQRRLVTAERRLTAQLKKANEELNGLNAQLAIKVAQRTQVLRRLYHFVSELNGLGDIHKIAALTVRTAENLLRSPLVSLWTADPQPGRMVAIGASDPNILKTAGLPIDQSLAGRTLGQEKLQVYENEAAANLTDHDRLYLLEFPVLALPLVVRGKPLGALILSGSSRGQFSENEITTGIPWPIRQRTHCSVNSIAWKGTPPGCIDHGAGQAVGIPRSGNRPSSVAPQDLLPAAVRYPAQQSTPAPPHHPRIHR